MARVRALDDKCRTLVVCSCGTQLTNLSCVPVPLPIACVPPVTVRPAADRHRRRVPTSPRDDALCSRPPTCDPTPLARTLWDDHSKGKGRVKDFPTIGQ